MERPRIWRRRDEVYRARPAGIADINYRKAIAEHVADKGMPLMDYDLHAIAAAVLVAMAYKFQYCAPTPGSCCGSFPACLRLGRPSFTSDQLPSHSPIFRVLERRGSLLWAASATANRAVLTALCPAYSPLDGF